MYTLQSHQYEKNNKGSQPGVNAITGRKMSVHEHDTIHNTKHAPNSWCVSSLVKTVNIKNKSSSYRKQITHLSTQLTEMRIISAVREYSQIFSR